jgi:prevent-host-death family protein
MEVNVHQAKTQLSKLIAAAESGEEVVIARNGKPAVRIVPVAVAAKRPRRELWGAGERLKITLPTDEEWKAMDKEIEDEMVNGPIFPPEIS